MTKRRRRWRGERETSKTTGIASCGDMGGRVWDNKGKQKRSKSKKAKGTGKEFRK